MGREVNGVFHVFGSIVNYLEDLFLPFKGYIVLISPIIHQTPHGANSWGTLKWFCVSFSLTGGERSLKRG